MIQEDRYVLDLTNKILLKKAGQIQNPTKCGQSTVWATEYVNLFLSPNLEPWAEMETDADITDFI